MMGRSDVLLVLGASFSNHTGISTKKKLIQVDYDRMTLGKFHPVDVPLWGDIGITADLLMEALANTPFKRDFIPKEIAARWGRWRAEKQSRVADSQDDGLNSAFLFQHLSDIVPENAVLAVDVGNNTYSFGRYFETKQGQDVLMSGYLGSIGFAMPASIGAWAATPDRPIIAVAGDGGFGQYPMEFTTAVKYNIPVKVILLNNSELGKISKEQRAGQWHVWQTSLVNPNFAEFAQSSGGWGKRVTDPSQLRATLAEAFAQPGPALVEVITDALKI